MAEEQPTDQPGGADADFSLEQSLDDALAQASSLVGSLSDEVGDPDGSSQPPANNAEPGKTADEPSDLDAELGALEDLLSEAGSELGDGTEDAATPPEEAAVAEPSEPLDPPEPANTDDSASIESASRDEPQSQSAIDPEETPAGTPSQPDDLTADETPVVPDFMSEFTQPEDPGDVDLSEPGAPPEPRPKSGVVGTPASPSPKPGVAGTGTLGVIGTPNALEAFAKKSAPNLPSLEELEAVALATAESISEDTQEKPRTSPLRIASTVASTLAFSLGDGVVRVLELIDKPIVELSAPFRRVVGLLALAMLSLTIVVFVLSLW